MVAASRREHLVQTALELFCQFGFRATGIDKVLAESGVAKKTLYNHFRSKDDLILEVLRQREEAFFQWWQNSIAEHRPRQTVAPELAGPMAMFDGLGQWFGNDDFYGCTFINASAEYPCSEHPIHQACSAHKRRAVTFVNGLLEPLRDSGRLTLEDSLPLAKKLAMLAIRQ